VLAETNPQIAQMTQMSEESERAVFFWLSDRYLFVTERRLEERAKVVEADFPSMVKGTSRGPQERRSALRAYGFRGSDLRVRRIIL